MEDIDIINEFKDKNNHINPNKTKITWLNKHPEFKTYLENRYNKDEFISYKFVLERIFHNINELPKCKNCGKKLFNIHGKYCNAKCQLSDVNFIQEREKNIDRISLTQKMLETKSKWTEEQKQEYINKAKQTKIEKYGENFGQVIYEKIKQTCLEKYNVPNVFQRSDFRELSKKTCLEKYGDEYFRNPNKTKQTIKEKYGIDNWMASEKFRLMSKQTKLEKYGENFGQVIYEKIKQTCLEKYGVDNWGKTEESIRITHTPEINKKREETKRKNHTFNTSKPEKESYILLKNKYIDTIYQYKDDRYPFNCDFYIPSLDLFIECNYHWTHGGHPYDPNNPDDIKQLNILQNKYKNKYGETWTIRDPKKRQVAKENNLNYLEF